jgi:hypothetical protein
MLRKHYLMRLPFSCSANLFLCSANIIICYFCYGYVLHFDLSQKAEKRCYGYVLYNRNYSWYVNLLGFDWLLLYCYCYCIATVTLQLNEEGATPSEENIYCTSKNRWEANHCKTLPGQTEKKRCLPMMCGHSTWCEKHFRFAHTFSGRRRPFWFAQTFFMKCVPFIICANIFREAQTVLVSANIFLSAQSFFMLR